MQCLQYSAIIEIAWLPLEQGNKLLTKGFVKMKWQVDNAFLQYLKVWHVFALQNRLTEK